MVLKYYEQCPTDQAYKNMVQETAMHDITEIGDDVGIAGSILGSSYRYVKGKVRLPNAVAKSLSTHEGTQAEINAGCLTNVDTIHNANVCIDDPGCPLIDQDEHPLTHLEAENRYQTNIEMLLETDEPDEALPYDMSSTCVAPSGTNVDGFELLCTGTVEA